MTRTTGRPHGDDTYYADDPGMSPRARRITAVLLVAAVLIWAARSVIVLAVIS